MDDKQTVIAALTGLFGGGSIVGLLTLLANRKKNSAEALLIKANTDNVLIGSALDFVKAIREEAIDLRKRAFEQETRAGLLEKKINMLEDHIRLQIEVIEALKIALAEYNKDHALLKRKMPPSPV